MEPSSFEASLEGPKHFKPRSLNLFVIPFTSGSSGPIIVRLIFSSSANLASPSISSASIETLVSFGSSSVPPFPGATKTCETLGL